MARVERISRLHDLMSNAAVQHATRRRVAAALLLCSMVLSAASGLHAAEYGWTVLTMARDGSWGVGTANSPGQAIAAAVHECRVMAAAPSDCGAQFRTTHGGWIIAKLCGDEKIIAADMTREETEREALRREADLKSIYARDLPPCMRVVTVAPDGAIVAPSLSETAQRQRGE